MSVTVVVILQQYKMIRKDDLIMASKKDFTIEELKKMKEDAAKEYETIDTMLKQKKKEEEEYRRAQLALEKESRKKELDDAINNTHKLLKSWLEDYGTYNGSTNADKILFDFLWPSIF